MAEYPKYDFTDPDLDYDVVRATQDAMYSDLLHLGDICCKSPKIERAFCQVDPMRSSMDWDKNNNYERYKDDVKSSYLILYPLLNC